MMSIGRQSEQTPLLTRNVGARIPYKVQSSVTFPEASFKFMKRSPYAYQSDRNTSFKVHVSLYSEPGYLVQKCRVKCV